MLCLCVEGYMDLQINYQKGSKGIIKEIKLAIKTQPFYVQASTEGDCMYVLQAGYIT